MAFPSLLKFSIRGSLFGRLLSFTTFHVSLILPRFLQFSSGGTPVQPEIELDRDRDLELELELDRDLGLLLSGAPGGDDGLLDPMSLPGAADDLDGLLDDDLDGLTSISRPRSRSRSVVINRGAPGFCEGNSPASLI